MKSIKTLTVLGLVLVSLSGCANMTPRERNTAIGAGVGAIGGSILTNGNALGTVGGAAVGGLVGNQIKH
ncbi:MAG: osmotically-inducible lipoprotein B [Halothiobacillus sp. 14-56-357]|jgi:osmotically inducible lipoprotein OsmB|uniref:glycine zipper 2TM domain-containing protein n=1 Tax=Halothiobacillus sp. 15-55-196 TaxID=1970382 RepID=UPI000BCDD1E4|nr:glycine zipper 2TM domain-containing protein [Halothiobacillus sp. 15-55-196]OZB36033.1 MAG: osmotically-inducible lipoprotein B [Halothiobacillus sp. 15-55-196]OZB56177.1 MAG: osmotically-inducible lipoprotein B [Halothiobacillus sp. 14-56-357]OZB78064.1 MAG: osmotically-inducible lipoprotein B [Halothiobacillus sp. 13-55-115]